MRNYEYSPRTNGNIEEKQITKNLNALSTIFIVVCLIASFLMLYVSSIYYSAEVVGTSMYPSINAENYDGTGTDDKAYYTITKTAQKGDIIIVDYKSVGQNLDAIKRLIATGGDTICYYGGHILVNGEALTESYLTDDYNYLKSAKSTEYADAWLTNGYATSRNHFNAWCKKLCDGELVGTTTFFTNYQTDYSNSITYNEALETYVLTLPENFFYFLGDNRGGSTDASIVGPLENKYLLAKVDFVTSGNETLIQYFWKQFLKLF